MFNVIRNILAVVGLIFFVILCFDLFIIKIKPKLKQKLKRERLFKVVSMYEKEWFLDSNFQGKYSPFEFYVFPIYDYDSKMYAVFISLTNQYGVKINTPYNDIAYMDAKKTNDEYMEEINNRIKKLIDFYESNR